jgi:hypothetical protein
MVFVHKEAAAVAPGGGVPDIHYSEGVPDTHYSGGRSGRRTRVAGGRRDALWSSLVPGSVCREDCLSVIARSALSDEDVAV